jgi:endo-1,4-beta-xylanase
MAQWIQGAIATRAGAERTLVDHITTVVGHGKGRMHSWDVVNEAIDDGNPELRHTPWFNALGADYIDIAFRAAREADDRLLLSYNDYGIQHADANSDRKRAAVLRLLEGMRRRNVPIDALGVQSHLGAGLPFDEQKFRRFIGEVAGMGLKVFISELDVRDRDLPADQDPRDQAVAELTKRFLDAALDERAVKIVVTWGVSDRHSWLNENPQARRTDGRPVRGLPLDEQMARKPMWRAMAAAFDGAPQR